MRELFYPDGREAGSTMTASELADKLLEYPPDMPVFGAWEGVTAPILPEEFSVLPFSKADETPCLYIDVEGYTMANRLRCRRPTK